MNEGSFKKEKPENLEQLAVRVEIAKPEDWEAYKELRLLAITGKDARLFGRSSLPGNVREEQNRTEQEWRDLLSRENRFIVLSWEGSRATGMGMARKREEEKDWWMGGGYVREDSRDKKTGKRIFAARLREIRRRHGAKIAMSVEVTNGVSIHIVESFGFKKVEGNYGGGVFIMELENVNAPEVVKKINEVLNAG